QADQDQAACRAHAAGQQVLQPVLPAPQYVFQIRRSRWTATPAAPVAAAAPGTAASAAAPRTAAAAIVIVPGHEDLAATRPGPTAVFPFLSGPAAYMTGTTRAQREVVPPFRWPAVAGNVDTLPGFFKRRGKRDGGN